MHSTSSTIRALLLVLAAPFAAAQPYEASVTVYTSNAAPTIQALSADFEKRHGVHVDVWRASSVKVL